MSKDYPNRQDWLAIRGTTVKPGRRIHASGFGRAMRHGKPLIPAGVTYNIGATKRKAAKPTRQARMAAMYAAFFADQKNMETIRELKFEWGIDMCPRLVRSEVIGHRQRLANQSETEA